MILRRKLWVVFNTALAIWGAAAQAVAETPTGTAFTYQGRLNSAGAAAAGTHDFKFRLYDSESGGNLVASEVSATANVIGGLFSLPLDFGAGAFGTDARWLEIEVRSGGTQNYTLLSPRQQVTPAPLATYAAAASNGVPAGFSVLGTSSTPPEGFHWTGRKVSTNENEEWVTKTDIPSPQIDITAAATGADIFVIGPGFQGRYDTDTHEWFSVPSIPTSRGNAASAVVNGKLFVLGGKMSENVLNHNEMYDPVTTTWSTKAPLPTPRFNHAAAVINGKLHVIGGTNNGTAVAAHDVYDPLTNSWTSKAPLQFGRSNMAVGVINGKLYVAGGSTVAGSNSMVMYDPATDFWVGKANLPDFRTNAVGVVLYDKFYVIGGRFNGAVTASVAEYDPIGDNWTYREPLLRQRERFAGSAAGNKGYVFGGGSFDTSGNMSMVRPTEEYTPPQATYFVHAKE